jgi:alanyl-tRNA synthetase
LKKQMTSGAKTATNAPSPKKTEATDEPSYAEVKAALRETARILNVASFDVPNRINALLEERTTLRQQAASQGSTTEFSAESLLTTSEIISNTKVIVAETPGAHPNLMRQLIDQIRKKSDSTAILLAASSGDDKVTLVAGMSRDLVDRGLSAGNWVRDIAPIVGGGGGGKPDMAQAGGKEPKKLPEAVATARDWIRRALQA